MCIGFTRNSLLYITQVQRMLVGYFSGKSGDVKYCTDVVAFSTGCPHFAITESLACYSHASIDAYLMLLLF